MISSHRIAAREAFTILAPYLLEYWTELGKAADDVSVMALQAQAALSMCDPLAAWFVAIEGEDVHGFACIDASHPPRLGGPVAWIRDFYVVHESRGTTEAAASLYYAVMRWAAEGGFRFVDANVSLSNRRVLTILSKYGFHSLSMVLTKDLLEGRHGRRKRRRKGRWQKLEGGSGELEGGDSGPQGHREPVLCGPAAVEDPGVPGPIPERPVHDQRGPSGPTGERGDEPDGQGG